MVTLGFFVILPLVWQLPICFITAELTTTFQVRRLPITLGYMRMHWLALTRGFGRMLESTQRHTWVQITCSGGL